ncbi:hypothetical protein WR25_11760 isoform B [Diploscapter pachys]|uniref:non-specific serine/threonine protein kinase n=1 Tax=Diploscapter pachys TaxID=2018661 RepID=A0A2A2JWT1_9BILA|nr:hypothetical protein WR25_11760 isoform B [Diploscapter pachys]
MSIDLESVEGSNSSGCSIEDKLPTKNCLIRGKEGQYAIGRKIAQGRYGAVFEVLRKSDGKRLACKLEVCETHSHGLDQDYVIMNKGAKKGCQYLIHMLDRGKIEEYFKFIIMPLLGDNLMSIKNMFEDGRLSLSSGIRLSYHALFSLQELHNTLHFVHRDIKPSNFCLPAHYNEHNIKLILIDYGICRSFKDKNGEWKNPRENVPFRGTTRYASLAAHYGKEQSPKDDLEAWFYMMVEFINGYFSF